MPFWDTFSKVHALWVSHLSHGTGLGFCRFPDFIGGTAASVRKKEGSLCSLQESQGRIPVWRLVNQGQVNCECIPEFNVGRLSNGQPQSATRLDSSLAGDAPDASVDFG